MRAGLLACLVFVAGVANAADSVSKRYETTFTPPKEANGALLYGFPDSMHFEGKFDTWFLLGEPVVNCTARWANDDASMTVAVPKKQREDAELTGSKPGEIEVYNLIIVAQGPNPLVKASQIRATPYIAALCDAGVVAQNGRSGFNVAGSPAWDHFLCALPDSDNGVFDPDRRAGEKDQCGALGGAWLSAGEAKAAAKKGLEFDDFEVLSAEVSGAKVVKRVEKRRWREASADFKRRRTGALSARLAKAGGFDGLNRQAALQRRLPALPKDNPSTEQLAAYEKAYQAALADLAPIDQAFTDEWREKERALVGNELTRIRAADDAVRKDQARLARYRAGLEKKAENEPKNPDPMAAFRTATLVPFRVWRDPYYSCGLKGPDGAVVVEDMYDDDGPRIEGDIYRCGARIGNSGVYVMAKRETKRYRHDGELYTNDGFRVDLFDDSGQTIVKNVRARSVYSLSTFDERGLIVLTDPYGYDQELTLFSLTRHAVVYYEHKEYAPYPIALVKHNGREAVLFGGGSSKYKCEIGGYNGGIEGFYVFIDSGETEDAGCVNRRDESSDPYAPPEGDTLIGKA